ncbi:hypothetical protein EVJ58_g9828 [Rhodofomes roseus]|uniref:Uncharacterized protein n=1 Tax=Rhodofomes roseus TaxID=34475 RepID=A0A4Y9XRL7_9APHY|nr:hypothetical protein EVJ58_g9828 [Rhodofomes roseus]
MLTTADCVRPPLPCCDTLWIDNTRETQAQYFRDPARLDRYLASNNFLASINNERPAERNTSYAAHLAGLNKFVLVLFLQDETVVPKESSWFGAYAAPNASRAEAEVTAGQAGRQDVGATEKTVVPMRLQPLYVEDWIGLRTLDERGAVVLETCDGEHMVLADECWQPLVRRFVGGETAALEDAGADLDSEGGEHLGLVVQA